MKLLVNKFDGDFVVLLKEDGTTLNINRRDVPIDAKEGDVLSVEGDIIQIDTAETAKMKEKARLLAMITGDADNKI
jgi:hypothetical protein